LIKMILLLILNISTVGHSTKKKKTYEQAYP